MLIMENIKTCELCLEQIIKTEDFENLNCDENQNLKILKNLAITVSKDADVCSNCVKVSHLMYNFKTSCLTNNDHLKTLIHPGINDKLVLEEVIVKNTKSEFKNEVKVCRFCLNFSEVNSLVEVNLEQDVVLKDMLGRCFPEIDMNIVQNPLICYICSELLEKLYNFISQCEDTEVLRNLDTKTDVVINENTSTVTVANNNDNIEKIFVKEENCEGLEDPELQIKSEHTDIDEDPLNVSNRLLKENEMEMDPLSFPSDPFRCKECFYKADSRMSLLIHWRTHRETRKLYKCTECLFQSKYQSSLVRHKENHKKPPGICKEKIELYKCNMCSFTASKKCEFVKHKKKDHKDRKRGLGNLVEEKDVKPKPRGKIKENKFVCDICSYQTTRKYSLQQHCLIHKELSEVNAFKCDYCPFATKWKKNLISHAIRHKNPSELPKFKCKICPYEAKKRSNLVRHVLLHKNPSDVNMYKCKVCSYQTKDGLCLDEHKKKHQAEIYTCDECDYKTKFKSSFMLHLRNHEESKQPAKSNPVEEEDVKPKPQDIIKEKKFLCDICSYQTTAEYTLKRHYLMHKELSEVNVFKCEHCPFTTKWNNSLISHAIRHKNPSELSKFKCNDCPYETIRKSQLIRHIRGHKNPSKVVKMYKCKVCPYQTKYISNIQLHKDTHQVEIYTCDECSYKTKLKRNFVVHLQDHKKGKQPAKSNQNPKKVKQFKCNECSYVGTQKSHLTQHQMIHKDTSERKMYNCTECSFQALCKISVKRHYKKNHSNLEVPSGEVKTFPCNECDYETMHKRDILKHLQTHEQEKVTPSVKEELQEQNNMQDKEGT